MAFWKCCLCLSFLVGVVSEDMPKEIQGLQITSVKFLPYLKKELPGLQELAKRLSTASDKEQVAILNEYADELIYNLNDFISKIGLDPLPLPGFEESFKWTIFYGWVSLEDGWLRGTSTIVRKGDVTLKYDYPNLKLHMVLGFSKLNFDYHYEAKYMGLGPSGTMDGKSKNSKFTVDLTLNMTDLKADLDRFRLNTIGRISLKFRGSIAGSLANILIAVVLPILKPIINLVLSGFITDGLESIVGFYNNVICTILKGCPEQLLNTVY